MREDGRLLFWLDIGSNVCKHLAGATMQGCGCVTFRTPHNSGYGYNHRNKLLNPHQPHSFFVPLQCSNGLIKKRRKREEEEELGLDQQMKEIMRLNDTDSEESALEPDSHGGSWGGEGRR